MLSTDSFDSIRGEHVLVTGGFGFVGLNLSRYLAEELDCRVTILDDCSNAQPPEQSVPHADIVIGDVRDRKVTEPLLRKHEWVFHLACRTILTCGRDPDADLSVNASSTLQMLEYLRHCASSRFRRFVYTSSTSIYGNCRHLPTDELDPPNILNHYAATKLLGEHYTLLYHTAYNVPTACVRYSNVYGPGQTTQNPYCGVIGKFMDAAAGRQPLTIHGDGEQTRDYTYVSDAVEGTVLAGVSPKAIGDVFNIGTGVETSVNELASQINALFGNRSPVEYIDRRDIDNIRRRALSPEKIRVRLGWQPNVRVRQGLRLMKEAHYPEQLAVAPLADMLVPADRHAPTGPRLGSFVASSTGLPPISPA